MHRLVLASILLSFLFCQAAHASENFRIGRPTAAEQGGMLGPYGSKSMTPKATTVETEATAMTEAPQSVFESSPQDGSAQPLLGDVIFAGMRTAMPRTAYARWRQNYCEPFVCNMVLCHGSCKEFEEHCPSFMESGRVIHVDAQSCMSSVASSRSSPKDCCK
jgi:hypothetical protein